MSAVATIRSPLRSGGPDHVDPPPVVEPVDWPAAASKPDRRAPCWSLRRNSFADNGSTDDAAAAPTVPCDGTRIGNGGGNGRRDRRSPGGPGALGPHVR